MFSQAPIAAILPVDKAKDDVNGETAANQELWHISKVSVMDSKKYKAKVEEQKKEEKDAHEEELKRISSAYNEQKQKLDLTMKLQQARQRQALQRKLFDRKAQKGLGESANKMQKL